MRNLLLAMSHSKRLAGLVTGSRLTWAAASRFVAGQTIAETMPVIKQLNDSGMRASLDYLGENVATEAEAAAAAGAYREALDAIQAGGAVSGISLKLTALGMDLGDELALAHLMAIVDHAASLTPVRFVRIDMEGSPYTARTLAIFEQVRERYANVGVVIQAYLYRSEGDIQKLISLGAGVRLCKGAYLESPDIAYPDKHEVDANYRHLADLLFGDEARSHRVYPAIASHDPAILGYVKQLVADRGVPRDRFEFQMLFGIRRDLQSQLVAEGYRMRVYVPFGEAWYPYFMRRLAERPENISFIMRNVLKERLG